MMVSFDVAGIPQPQGSTRAFRRGARVVVTTDNPKLHAWRQAVAWEAKRHVGPRLPYHGAVRVEATFRLPRPKGCKREAPMVRPDLDKLARSIGDAMTGIVFRDDSAIVEWSAQKRYASPPETPGVWITVQPWTHGHD